MSYQAKFTGWQNLTLEVFGSGLPQGYYWSKIAFTTGRTTYPEVNDNIHDQTTCRDYIDVNAVQLGLG